MNRKVFWMICAIHTNELPLRHLIEVLGKKYPSVKRFLYVDIFQMVNLLPKMGFLVLLAGSSLRLLPIHLLAISNVPIMLGQ